MLIMMMTGAVVYSLGGIAQHVPVWLGSVLPAVEVTGGERVSRTKDAACVVIHVHKLRRGAPLKPIFQVEAVGATYSPMVGLAVHRTDKDCNRVDEPLTEHPIGMRWDSYYGFDMPGTITPDDSVSVSGRLLHRRWFGAVEEPIPPFTVCPANKVLKRQGGGEACRSP